MTEVSKSNLKGKNVVPDTVESLGEIDRCKDRVRARLGFVKPIRNGLRITKNLIKSRLIAQGGNQRVRTEKRLQLSDAENERCRLEESR